MCFLVFQLVDFPEVIVKYLTCDTFNGVNSLLFIFFQEIIEFPCIKINADTCEIEDVFHQYIQPKERPVITPYCTELTGIMQVNFKPFLSLIYVL
jgi:ERI1 exoribonuclease 3